MNREELLSLLRQHMDKGSELGDKLVTEIIRQVNAGSPLAKAIETALANTGFTGQYCNQLIDTICSAALLGYGIKVPSMQMKAAVRKHLLSDFWAPDKMKLSKRLHGTSKEMRQAIIDTVAAAMRKCKTVRQIAMDLYDGYNSGKKVINGAELPQYLQRMVTAARSAAGGDRNITREFNLAVRKAQQQLEKMEQQDKPLRVAYQQLVDAAQMLNKKAMEKAAWVAVQEKARYYADRIATTESARAWSDMFYARNYDDSLVIGFGWRLSTRHPRVDICDFHAKVDHYGMGAGNYPKDKMPAHPAHPFCTCNLVVLYKDEAEPGKFNPDAGAAWLKAQDTKARREMLGIEGAKDFEQDDKWQKRLRHWQGHKDPKPKVKLKELLSKNGNVILIISDQQIGKKIGKHAEDYGLDASNPKDRAWLVTHINAIFTEYQEKRIGTFRGQGPGGTRGEVIFYRKDNDVVVTSPDSQFVTILKDRIHNQSYLNASKEEGEE